MGIRHPFHSAISDDGLPAGAVKPSDWNTDHEIDGLLGALKDLAVAANVIPYLDGAQAGQVTPLSALGLLVLNGSNVPAIRAALGLALGVNVAAIDSPTFTGVPTAPTAALGVNSSQIATMAAVQAAISALIGGSPAALDTLKELADAINDDASFAATVTTALGNRLRVDVAQGLTSPQKAQAIANLSLATVAASGAYADLTGRPTLGTAAALNVGTGINNVVQLDGAAKLPAVDGSQLTGISVTNTVATQAQAQAGTDNVTMMTPLRAAQSIAQRAPHGHLWGLNCSNDGTSPLTVLDIATGESASQNGFLMSAGAFTKNCNAAWAVGTGNGALDTGAALAASTWYHLFQIMRTDTWVVDYLISTSATAPTMPTGYTEKRRVASFKTDASSHIVAFTQVGDIFTWSAAVYEGSISVGTARTTQTLAGVPSGFAVTALLVGDSTNGTAGGTKIWIGPLSVTDAAPSVTASPGLVCEIFPSASNTFMFGPLQVLANASAQIGMRATNAATTTNLITSGFIDTRGRLF